MLTITKLQYVGHKICIYSDTLLLANIFKSFGNKCLESYNKVKINPSHFLLIPQIDVAYLKRTEVKLKLLKDANRRTGINNKLHQGCHKSYYIQGCKSQWQIHERL